MTTNISFVSGTGIGASALGDLRPSNKEIEFYNQPDLLIAGNAASGRRNSGQDFTLEDRLNGEVFSMAETISSNVAPVYISDALGTHGALVFGGESVGGGIVERNGALIGSTTLTLSSAFSLVMIGHGNGNGPNETSGALLAVGGNGQCFAIRHTTTGAYQAALDNDGVNFEAATSASVYGPEDMQIVIASFDPATNTATINVNDADVVENTGMTFSAADGPMRFGQVKRVDGGDKWAARESRIVEYGFFSCDLHAPDKVNIKAAVLDFYREVAGL